MEPYLKALSEWEDSELALVNRRLAEGSLHPMDLKRIVAGEVTAALHGVDGAMRAREEFEAQFSRRKFADVEDLPEVTDVSQPVVEVVKALGFASSNSEVRRVAEQKGLRLVLEPANGDGQQQLTLGPDDIRKPLSAVLEDQADHPAGACYLKVGRKIARISRPR
jgi:tyrosyl-tRNA synthetase